MLRPTARRGDSSAHRPSPPSPRARGKGRHRHAPLFDELEPRRLLTTFDVTNTSDDPSTTGSLPYEIDQSNSTPGSNYIAFAIPASTATNLNVPVSGFNTTTQLWTITLTQPLPIITNPVDIDGLSEAHVGEYYNYPANFSSEVDSLTIDPTVTSGEYEISIASYTDQAGVTRGGTTQYIQWDATAGFIQGQLSALVGTGNVTVSGPTQAQSAASYTITFGGNSTGQAITESIVNSTLAVLPTLAVSTAGGVASGTPTEILSSPNSEAAITGDNAENHVVIDGSQIDRTTYPSPVGFELQSSYSMIRGLDITGFATGVSIDQPTDVGDLVQGNFIGDYIVHPVSSITGEALTAPYNEYILPDANTYSNSGTGVIVFGTNSTVGGDSPQDNNVITDNGAQGVFIEPGAEGAQVLGNQIGVLGPSTAGLYYKRANGSGGILIEASSNRIGTAGAGNIISANLGNGIEISGQTTTQNVVAANYIGEAPGGGYVFGNGTPGNTGDGILILNAPNNIIGETNAGNAIASNDLAGIDISGATAVSNIIADNIVGLTSDATQVVGNDEQGIINYSPNTQIGPSNVVSGNNLGILIEGSSATNINIIGNLIGTDGTGEQDLGNAQQGIEIDGASGVTIQGNAAGSQVISGNNIGIDIEGPISSNNLIFGNLIGTDKAGTLALPNAQQGILINDSSGNTIGGTSSTSKNLISANYWGLQIESTGSTGNLVQGNLIGTDITGLLPLGNEIDGILISNSANGNTIGGLISSQGNTIGFNTDAGVEVFASKGDPILSNSIFSNGQIGIQLDSTTDPGNDNIASPVLESAATHPTTDTTEVRGSYTNVENETFLIQFFSNTSADPAGNYEGETLIGSTTVTTNSDITGTTGTADFDLSLQVSVTSGDYITATATFLTIATPPVSLTNGDTSEFSDGVVALNPYLVTSTADSTTNPAVGTLRYAIDYSNQSLDDSASSPNVIQFQIPGNTIQTIYLQAGLVITQPVTIDGFTQTGSASNPNNIDGGLTDLAVLTIQIDGSQINQSTDPDAIGLTVEAPGSTIDGLAITAFQGGAIALDPSQTDPLTASLGDTVWGNDLGVTQFIDTSYNVVNPTTNRDANGYGILINSPNNVVGGLLPSYRNLIQGNTSDGVVIYGSQSTNNSLESNFILDNGGDGVLVLSASNQIGVASGQNLAGAGNLISGNEASGVHILGPAAHGNTVENNQIGTNVGLLSQAAVTPLGATARANLASGVTIENAPNNIIGASTSDAGNALSGNALAGLTIGNYVNGQVPAIPNSSSIIVNPTSNLHAATGNTVQGNEIGYNEYVAQIYLIPNQRDGINISSASNIIGGNSLAAQNIIIDNSRNGIAITASALDSSNNITGAIPNAQPNANIIQGNYIGTQAGTNRFGNAVDGILLLSALTNTIGGTTSGAGNVISSNGGAGIALFTSTSNVLIGNNIGTTADGTTPLGNTGDGIALDNSLGNTIGGTTSGAANLIAANANGIHLSGSATSYNVIQSNLIGINSSGSNLLGNTLDGILIDTNASNNLIGSSTSTTAGNTIDDNTETGVEVSSGTGNSILSNSIYSNGQLGIVLDGTGNNAIPAPIVTSATPLINSTTIIGTFSNPNLPYTSILIQVFSNQTADPSGYGQGQTLIGSTTLNTNSSGAGTFTLNLAAGVAPGLAISATATNIITGDTSAFSADTVNAAQIEFSSSVYAASEPLSSYSVTVIRDTTYGTSTVNFSATAGTAIPNVDFTPVAGTLVFSPGQSYAAFSVPISSSVSSNFTILLGLSTPTSAILGSPSTATLEINSIPGTIALSSSAYQVAAGTGSTTIPVNRLVGASGTVTVNYTAVYSQAFAAVPTGSLSGTLVFTPGIAQQGISLPIPATASSPYNSIATITLSSPTGGASLGSPTTATLTITQPLTITAEQIIASGAGITAVQLTFSAPLDPAQAQNLSNYGYYAIHSGSTGTFIDPGVDATKLSSASYNPTNLTVTVNLSSPLRFNTFYRFTVDGLTNGILYNGISDPYGNLLAGNGTNPGTSYVVTFGVGTHLTYTDNSANIVSLKLNHGGLIEMFRYATGSARQIVLVGTTPRSTLTGSVRRVVRAAGRTSLPTIIAPSGGKLKLPASSFILSNPAITTDSVSLAVSATRLRSLVQTPTSRAAVRQSTVSLPASPYRNRVVTIIKRTPGDPATH
jgi:hypothetical protein